MTAIPPTTPLSAGLRRALSNATVESLLDHRGLRGIRPIVLTSDATVGDAMEALARHKISSLPVVSPDSRSFLGFVDVPFFLAAFFAGDFLKAIPTPPTAAPPRHSQTAETLIAHPSKLPGDEPQPAHYPMLSLLQTLNEQGPVFASLPLSSISPKGLGRDGELFTAMESHSLLELAQVVLRPAEQGSSACHRIAVCEAATAPSAPLRITSILSQTDLLRWIASWLLSAEGAALGDATLERLRLSPKPVLCVDADTPAIEAYHLMLRHGVSVAGVTRARGSRGPSQAGGSAGSGSPPQHPAILIGSLALAETRGVVADKLGTLALPTAEFLALRHGGVWSSMGDGGGGAAPGAAGGLTLRDLHMQRKTLSALPPGATLKEAVDKLLLGGGAAGRAVFVSDPSTSSPLSVVTASDVLRVAVMESDPWE